jgi:hypothetical protein
MGVRGQLHVPAALPPGKVRRYRLDSRMGVLLYCLKLTHLNRSCILCSVCGFKHVKGVSPLADLKPRQLLELFMILRSTQRSKTTEAVSGRAHEAYFPPEQDTTPTKIALLCHS